MAGRGFQTALLVVVACVIGVAHTRLPSAPRSAGLEAGYLPDPTFARVASVGFDALLADLYWFQAVQIAGSREGPMGHGHRIGALVDLVTRLDPWVDHPYRFAALWMTEDVESIRKANALLERGIEHHPDEWRNRFYLAFNHFYYLGEDEPAARALEPAVGMPGAPRYLGRLVARLKSHAGDLETSSAFLSELIRRAPDEYAKASYRRALDEIETERRARLLDRARELFRQRQGRDLESVSELVTVPPPVLRRLPPEPHGAEWVLDDRGVIVSAKLRYRYEPKIDGTSRAVIRKIHESSAEEGGAP